MRLLTISAVAPICSHLRDKHAKRTVGAGIISFFKRRGQSAIDALDAVIPGKSPPVPPKMTAALRELDKQGS